MWQYEIRDTENRLVETRREYPTEEAAREAGTLALRALQEITPGRELKLLSKTDGSSQQRDATKSPFSHPKPESPQTMPCSRFRAALVFPASLLFLIFLSGCSGVGGVGGSGAGSGSGGGTAPVPMAAADSVAVENTKPGTTDWQLTNPAKMYGNNDLNPSDYAKAEMQGYASLTSVNRGGSINFYVRTINTNPYTLSIFRMGWYNGLGGRLMFGPITLPGVIQTMPLSPVYQPTGTGIVECNWSVSYSLSIPTDWVSGYYLVKLSLSSPAAESYIVFVVRDDTRNSPVLVQSSVTTYQAYNEWGGSSLYTRAGGVKTGYEVSFNRPYWRNYGAGDFISLDGPPGYEMQLVRWLERQGYDATYVTDVDTHENSNLLLSHKVFLVIGHDEYWSWDMRTNVTKGRDAGVNLGFLGANICVWQIRFAPSSSGGTDRTIIGYKELASMDPVSDPRLVTTHWRDINPEGNLIGVQYNNFSKPTVSDMVVTNASHWLFSGTGVSNGTIFPNVVGYETDSLYPPAGAIGLAHSPFPRTDPKVHSDMSVYTASSGAIVFATGTIEWSLGLDDFPPSQGAVPGVQQVTANFLSRALQGTPAP